MKAAGKRYIYLVSLGLSLFSFLLPAHAQSSLDSELTPLGAIRAGNKSGSIPAWTGGITNPPAGYKVGGPHVDPFSEDELLFTITAENAENYQQKLSEGQLALLKQYPDYKMKVFPTRRSASYPEYFYRASIANTGQAKLTPEGNGFVGAITGIPFAQPNNGLEVIWNHLVRFRGVGLRRHADRAPVTQAGDYNIVRSTEEFYLPYSEQDTNFQALNNKLVYFKQAFSAPARLAGLHLLVHESLNKDIELRQSWSYSPGLRRVRRAPFIAYDAFVTSADGLRTFDQFDMYNGAPDRYDWKLLGREEIYVPYNSYRLHGKDLKYRDILKPKHINMELARYELHRVWKIEATIKENNRHLYHRRVFYIDEDSWQVLLEDVYDKRGGLWRVSEAHVINFYEVPALWTVCEVHHDLKSRRYLAKNMSNEAPAHDFAVTLDASNFRPVALRQAGLR